MTISGFNFGTAQVSVKFGSKTVKVTPQSDTQVQINVPSLAPKSDPYDVTVTTKQGTSNVVMFTVTAPLPPLVLKTEKDISKQFVITTHNVLHPSPTEIVADVRFTNNTGTWFLIIREGNHSASEAQIPFAFLAGPKAVITFPSIHFMRGEELRFAAERWASLDDNPATIAMVAIDLIGRGLFGVEAPNDLFSATSDELQQKLVNSIAGAFGSVGSIAQAADALRRGKLPEAVTALAQWLKSVDPTSLVDTVHDVFALVNDATADEVTNSLVNLLTNTALGTVAQLADAILSLVDVVDFPRRYQSMKELGKATNQAPLDGYAVISAQ